jgi:hypothetical protein
MRQNKQPGMTLIQQRNRECTTMNTNNEELAKTVCPTQNYDVNDPPVFREQQLLSFIRVDWRLFAFGYLSKPSGWSVL